MKIRVEGGSALDFDVDALVVGVYEGETLEQGLLKDLNDRTEGIIAEIVGGPEMKGKAGESVYLHRPRGVRARRILLAGLGKRDQVSFESVIKYCGSAARFLRSKGVKTFAILRVGNDFDPPTAAEAAAVGMIASLFEPDKYKTKEKDASAFSEVIIHTPDLARAAAMSEAAERGRVVGEAMNMARELSNEPASALTPTEMANRAASAASHLGLEIEVLEEARMKELGMGALLGVSQGSDEPAKLIVLTYTPTRAADSRETIAVVGKGITFDSGGISIKPAEGMDRMKYDMSGAAVTLASMTAIAQLKPPVKVIGLMPTSENMPSGHAYKPGDVLRAMSGKTIEVVNTDAEGRLVLADAICYARRLGATRIIDLATLTGACSIALGAVNVALLGNNQEFMDEVRAAAKHVGERLWQLPMDDEYKELIKSDIADVKNSGGRYGGTITAALFLKEFVEETPWVHLDIAGTAWGTESKSYMAKGPTGIGVRTVVNYVLSHARQTRS
ncbi:MAG TPA: leucyl aminopeptidase [Blastocatellia bacterium]|nr:leucyl aminopeptidase [Blastocatellia bacterium]